MRKPVRQQKSSRVLRQRAAQYLVRRERAKRAASAWELGIDLFGTDRSTSFPSDTSAKVKQLLRERLRAKHSG